MRIFPSVSPARLREVLQYEASTGVFRWLAARRGVTVGAIAGNITARGYRTIFIDGRNYKAGRLAWLYVFGEWPLGEIDHEDLNKQNDRIGNLRLATRQQNGSNRHGWAKSRLKGAYHTGRPITKPWLSIIRSEGKKFHLGYFQTAEEAHTAYCAAASRLHGSFARTTCAS